MNELGVWKRIGCIGVDACMVMIADPGYVLHRGKKLAKDFGPDWGSFVQRVDGEWREKGRRGAQLRYDKGHPGLAVVVDSNAADGVYEVWGRFVFEECLELRISFDGLYCGMRPPDGEDELPAVEGPPAPCHVAGCSAPAVCICDYTDKRTACNKRLCATHRHAAGPDVDYCPEHAKTVAERTETPGKNRERRGRSARKGKR
jgi:hypothetical protein